MKILLIAYACEPNKTSEPGVGWNFSREISNFDMVKQVTIITRANNQKNIELQNENREMIYIYYDLAKPFLFIKKKIPMGIQIYYILWQFGAYLRARKLIKKERKVYDLLHHLTFGVSKISPPAFLLDIPFIWGPIGGGDKIPWNFLKEGSVKNKLEEFIYIFIHKLSYLSPFGYLTRKKAKAIMFRTRSTRENFPKNGCQNRTIICETAINPTLEYQVKKIEGSLYAVCIGRLMFGKGYMYALQGFHSFLKNGGNGKLAFFGIGAEEKKLKAYVAKFGLENSIVFHGFVSNDTVHEELLKAHVLLHPSFREGGSWSIIEAMSYATPVISLDLSGPKDMLTSKSGIKIKANSPKQVISDIEKGLKRLYTDNGYFEVLSKNAYLRVKNDYSWEERARELKKIYQEVLNEN